MEDMRAMTEQTTVTPDMTTAEQMTRARAMVAKGGRAPCDMARVETVIAARTIPEGAELYAHNLNMRLVYRDGQIWRSASGKLDDPRAAAPGTAAHDDALLMWAMVCGEYAATPAGRAALAPDAN